MIKAQIMKIKQKFSSICRKFGRREVGNLEKIIVAGHMVGKKVVAGYQRGEGGWIVQTLVRIAEGHLSYHEVI